MGRSRKWVLEDNQFVTGCVEDNPQRPPSTTRRMATWVQAKFYNRSNEKSRRPLGRTPPRQPTGPRVPQDRANLASTMRSRVPRQSRTSGGRIEGAWRGQPAQPLKEVLKKAQDQRGEDREDASRVGSRKDAVATSIASGGTKRRRIVSRRLGFCLHQRWTWPHWILRQN